MFPKIAPSSQALPVLWQLSIGSYKTVVQEIPSILLSLFFRSKAKPPTTETNSVPDWESPFPHLISVAQSQMMLRFADISSDVSVPEKEKPANRLSG